MARPPYRAFVLRVWPDPGPPPAYLVEIEVIATGERRTFASLPDAYEFVTRAVGAQHGEAQP